MIGGEEWGPPGQGSGEMLGPLLRKFFSLEMACFVNS